MNANEPAYPRVSYISGTLATGLTKRELIAAMCLQGLLALPMGETLSGETIEEVSQYIGIDARDYHGRKHYPLVVAKSATKYADALLAELEKVTT